MQTFDSGALRYHILYQVDHVFICSKVFPLQISIVIKRILILFNYDIDLWSEYFRTNKTCMNRGQTFAHVHAWAPDNRFKD